MPACGCSAWPRTGTVLKHIAALLVTALPIIEIARAQSAPPTTFPDRLIKIIVPFAPGGPTDVAARLVVDQMSPRLNQPVVIESQAGAGGRTGSKMVARAQPDGYTLLVGGTNLNAVVPAIYKQLDYDPVHDFDPVAAIATDPLMLAVWPGLSTRTVADLIADAKARPGKVSAGAVVGIGQHFATELFKKRTAADITFPISGDIDFVNVATCSA